MEPLDHVLAHLRGAADDPTSADATDRYAAGFARYAVYRGIDRLLGADWRGWLDGATAAAVCRELFRAVHGSQLWVPPSAGMRRASLPTVPVAGTRAGHLVRAGLRIDAIPGGAGPRARLAAVLRAAVDLDAVLSRWWHPPLSRADLDFSHDARYVATGPLPALASRLHP
ncbi:MAG TPA: hypothetical protein VGN37_24680 [Actinocatenispora sp.]